MPLHLRLHYLDGSGINHDMGCWPLRTQQECLTALEILDHLLQSGRVPRGRIAWEGQQEEEAMSPLELILGVAEGSRGAGD